MKVKMTHDRALAEIHKYFGENVFYLTSKQMNELEENQPSAKGVHWFAYHGGFNKVRRGVYAIVGGLKAPMTEPKKLKAAARRAKKVAASKALPVAEESPSPQMSAVAMPRKQSVLPERLALIPEQSQTFVPFGVYSDVKKLLSFNDFYPILISGPTGNGKTEAVKQSCAILGRPLVQINITPETDKFDLVGNYELLDGQTLWVDGPVVLAMKLGAVLLLDEVDYASGNKLSCIQEILNSGSYYDKNRNVLIKAEAGFTIVATANTRLKGDNSDGGYIGANILNEAFIERFVETLIQEYPPQKVEERILQNVAESLGVKDDQFIENLCRWAGVVRKTFDANILSDNISTRRLVMIMRSFAKREDRVKAIRACINRFDDRSITAFMEFYKKIDLEANGVVAEEKSTDNTSEIPF